MAYIDTREPFATATHIPAAAIRAAGGGSAAAGFDQREWNVVALARRDALSSLRAPTRMGRLAERLFGATVDKRLADPRLEALRRFAVLAWHHGYQLPVSAMKALKDAGYTPDQLELLLARIATDRLVRGAGAAA